MVRADLITSVVLMVLGLATAEESWRMPRYVDVGSSFWAAPGIVPGMLGIALAIMAFILFARSLQKRRAGAFDEPGEEGAWKRVALVLGMCVLYAGVLVGHVPFWLATFVFVFAFILVFELIEPEARARWVRHVLLALIIAAVTSGAVSYIFQSLFFVRLP